MGFVFERVSNMTIELNGSDTVFDIVLPAIFIPVGVADVILNILLMLAHLRLKFWQNPSAMAYFNMLFIGLLSSTASVGLFASKIHGGVLDNHNRVHPKGYISLVKAFYTVEIYVLGSGLISTFILVVIRLMALRITYLLDVVLKRSTMVLVIVGSWAVGSALAYVEFHYWDHKYFWILWAVYVVSTLVLFVIAVVRLFPLLQNRDPSIRHSAYKLFVLALFYFVCFGLFGWLNIARYFVCQYSAGRAPGWCTELLCNHVNFYTVIIILPTVNSIANAIVIATSVTVRTEIKGWFRCDGVSRRLSQVYKI